MKLRIKKFKNPSGTIDFSVYPKGFGLWTQEALDLWRLEHPTVVEDLRKANQSQELMILTRSNMPLLYVYTDPETGMSTIRYYSGRSEALDQWNPEQIAVLASMPMKTLGKFGNYLFGGLGLLGLTQNAGSESNTWFGNASDWAKATADLVGGAGRDHKWLIRDNLGNVIKENVDRRKLDLGHVGWGLNTVLNEVLPVKLSAAGLTRAMVPLGIGIKMGVTTTAPGAKFIKGVDPVTGKTIAIKVDPTNSVPFRRGEAAIKIPELNKGRKGGDNIFLFDSNTTLDAPMKYARMLLEAAAEEKNAEAIELLKKIQLSPLDEELILRNSKYLVDKEVPQAIYDSRVIFDPGNATIDNITAPISFGWNMIPGGKYWNLSGNTFTLDPKFIEAAILLGALSYNEKTKTFHWEPKKMQIKYPGAGGTSAENLELMDTNELSRATHTEYSTGKTTQQPTDRRGIYHTVPADPKRKEVIPMIEFKSLRDAGGVPNYVGSTYMVHPSFVYLL